jgi:hypothetical protein
MKYLAPTFLVLALVVLALLTAYGDTLTGINPPPAAAIGGHSL